MNNSQELPVEDRRSFLRKVGGATASTVALGATGVSGFGWTFSNIRESPENGERNVSIYPFRKMSASSD